MSSLWICHTTKTFHLQHGKHPETNDLYILLQPYSGLSLFLSLLLLLLLVVNCGCGCCGGGGGCCCCCCCCWSMLVPCPSMSRTQRLWGRTRGLATLWIWSKAELSNTFCTGDLQVVKTWHMPAIWVNFRRFGKGGKYMKKLNYMKNWYGILAKRLQLLYCNSPIYI